MCEQKPITTKINTACGSELHNSITLKQPATPLQAANALKQLKGFIGNAQRRVLVDLVFSEEKQFFFDKLVELGALVTSMPQSHETDGQGGQAIAYLHYFTASADWYIIERDCLEDQLQAFGVANLGQGGELGYISIVALLDCGAELDFHFQPCTLASLAYSA